MIERAPKTITQNFLDKMANSWIPVSSFANATSLFNRKMQNLIPCRVFEKTHIQMDLCQDSSTHDFEPKITFVNSFSKKKYSKIYIFTYELIRKIQQNIMILYWMLGWFWIFFFAFLKNLKRNGHFFIQKATQKIMKNYHKIFIYRGKNITCKNLK